MMYTRYTGCDLSLFFSHAHAHAEGTDVSVSATCFPNGSATFTWSSHTDDVRRIQIEYQCLTVQDTDEQVTMT